MKTISFVILSVLLLLSCSAYAQHDDAALADSCLKTASNSYEADTVKKYASIAYTLSQRLNDEELDMAAAAGNPMMMETQKNKDNK